MTSVPAASMPNRVAGLDSIRFVCALIVVFFHTGQPPIGEGIDTSSRLGWAVHSLVGNMWSSATAVIVFFVISGFCIHYPVSRTLEIRSLPGYYARRYFRIAIPMAIAVVVSSFIGVSLRLFQGTILWSLAAELIYYTLYPLLLLIRRRVGSWIPMIAVGLVIGLAIAATKPTIGEYPKFGLGLNWLLGLPCWLAGCQLADWYRARGPASKPVPYIWWLRAGMWGAMIACSVLRYHTPLGYPWTLNFFALLAAVWISFEIRHFSARPPNAALEALGVWSYSLYLTHKLSAAVFEQFGLPSLGPVLDWAVRLGFILIVAYLFYLLCENPSHKLARLVAAKVAPAGAQPGAGGPAKEQA